MLGLAGVCVVVTRYDPALWLHPFGPVTKNVPVLIGTGIPLFGVVPRDIRLDHVATREYPGGMVQSEYTVAI